MWVRACVGVLCFGMVGELEGGMFSVSTLVWHSQTQVRKREWVWYHAYTSSVSVELAECNIYDVNFIMRVLTKI